MTTIEFDQNSARKTMLRRASGNCVNPWHRRSGDLEPDDSGGID
jgi:hypothetical protein